MKSEEELENFCLSAFLAFSGGLQDAYTYNTRGHVFANAQTGNIVLMSQHLMNGHLDKVLNYLLPLLAFMAGIFVAEQLQNKKSFFHRIHWKGKILLLEIIALFIVGFIPKELNFVANMLVSFACALQVQSFQRLRGNPFASTMCIGNMKGGTAAFSSFIREKKIEKLKISTYYFGIILVFALGAGFGGLLSIHYGYLSIWCSCIILSIPLYLIHHR